jgi:hypothetical protein
MPTINELGQKFKAKYPGTYDDLSDSDVGQKVKAKWPGDYDDFTDAPSPTRGGEALSRGVPPALQEKRKAAVQGLLKTATPVVDNPIVNTATYPLRSGVTQAAGGMVRTTQPAYTDQQGVEHSRVDNALGGAADIVEGGLTAYAPFGAGSMVRAAIKNPLKTAGAILAGAVTVPAARMLGPELGLGPGATQLASDIAGFYAGKKAYDKLPGAGPKRGEYDEAEFSRILNPSKNEEADLINREGTGAYQKGLPELRDSDPRVKTAKNTWAEPEGSYTEFLAKEVGPKAQQRWWDGYEQLAEPFRDKVRFIGDEIANFLETMPQGKIRGEHSDYLRGLAEKYRGSIPSLREVETDLRDINAYTSAFHSKAAAAQAIASRQDVADVDTLNKLGAFLREKIYTSLDQEAGGDIPAEMMRKFGATKEVTDQLSRMITSAQQKLSPQRAKELALGLAEAKLGWWHAVAQRAAKMVGGGEKTIDQALMDAFAKYKAPPTPMPDARPELVVQMPPWRRLSAPTGPVGVSGVTVPDVSGQVMAETNRISAGPKMLPAPTGPVGISGVTMPDARGQIIDLVNQETSGQRMLPPATPGGPARDVTSGVTQGNLGLGSQHSQVRPSVYQMPERMPVPNNPPVQVNPQPVWPSGGQLSMDVIEQFAQRNRISVVEALNLLQKKGGVMPPPQRQPQQIMPPPGQ